MAIEPFTGPLTAGKISDWLSRCEEFFDRHDEANSMQKLTNKQKIQRAVASISPTQPASKSLSTWYTQNRRIIETKGWDDFRDMLKEHALGKGRRIKVLRDFHSYSQGVASLDDYFEKFEELEFTVTRMSKLDEINDMTYKCRLLFGSRPSLVDKFMRAHKNDQQFIDFDVEEIRTMLKDFDLETPGSSQPGQQGSTQTPDSLQGTAAAGFYITSGLLGPTDPTSGATYFSSLDSLPSSSNAVQNLTRVRYWCNDVFSRPQIQLVQTWVGGRVISTPSTFRDFKKYVEVDLVIGEHLIQVIMTRDNAITAISSYTFKTSFGKEYFIGNNTGERATFTAPQR